MWLSQCCYDEPLYPIKYEDDGDEEQEDEEEEE